MTTEKLVHMANEIARNLKSQDPAGAVAATADHLKKFWTPKMRNVIVAHLTSGGDGLDLVAFQAVELLRGVSSSR